MKPYVKDRYTNDILGELGARYGIDAQSLVDLGGFESFVYEFDYAGEPAILKVSHSDRRSLDLLRSEAAFTRYLAGKDISVASVMLSARGRLAEPVADGHGSEFIAMAWSKAPGTTLERRTSDPVIWHEHGRVLGAIHAATTRFTPPGGWFTRPHWDDPLHLEDSMFIPESDEEANAEMRRLLARMRSLPRVSDSYGLVHMDAHGGNTHWDGTSTTLFDFDDCGYTWFADDIAIVMYYALTPFDDPVAAAETIWPAYIAGYQESWQLDTSWFEHFPTFLSWRDHLLYSIIFRSHADDDEFDTAGWVDRFHARHASGRPIVDYDFTSHVR